MYYHISNVCKVPSVREVIEYTLSKGRDTPTQSVLLLHHWGHDEYTHHIAAAVIMDCDQPPHSGKEVHDHIHTSKCHQYCLNVVKGAVWRHYT